MNQNKRIACFFESLPPSGGGGAALRGHSIAEALVKFRGATPVDLRFYTATPDPHPIDGVEIKSLPSGTGSEEGGLLRRVWREGVLGIRVGRQVFRANPKSTTLLVSSPSYIAACIICLAAMLRRMPFILDIRDIYPQAYVASNLIAKDGVLHRILDKFSAYMYKRAALIFTATAGLKNEVEKYPGKPSVVHIANGFPSLLLNVQSEKHARFTVCFHGVLGFFQDVESIVILADRLAMHDIDVVVVGYGRKSNLLEDNQNENLRYLGRKSFEETIQEVSKCHVGLCLRLDEDISKDAFPVKVWEYLGLAIPTIVTPPCDAGEFLELSRCGAQYNAGDVEQIYSAILRLKDDADLYSAMQEACRGVRVMHTREAYAEGAAKLILAGANN
ncbi:glycosyltransferase family 4 protein [Chitinimonas arctica]|uniref:Glycosyltransferase family 4 protein n=1 Tax=Chitinimonas arctica TaxID=2594795 RepID=A0A516SC48_9NEIS|nr:glycosyltransferase family 4 protein [Chitinimonas arctica]QDQ25721.1 glycosyltransferase family 4 protein [Chitinimonas arctica]